MSKNSIIALYRYLNKNITSNNLPFFRQEITNEIKNFQNLKFESISEKEKKIKEWDSFIKYYLEMKNHINRENKLLESYNINVVRDSRREIESVARKVGLEI